MTIAWLRLLIILLLPTLSHPGLFGCIPVSLMVERQVMLLPSVVLPKLLVPHAFLHTKLHTTFEGPFIRATQGNRPPHRRL